MRNQQFYVPIYNPIIDINLSKMKNTAKSFYSLRVYKQLSTYNILNLMLCNRLMKVKPLVANSAKLYKYSKNILGSTITHYALNQTFCRALTAGNTLQEAEKIASQFRKQNIAIILDYCAEGQIGSPQFQVTLDQNAKMFARSAEALCKNPSEMISIKITGLVDMHLLKRMNDSVLERNKFWTENSTNGIMTGQQMFKGIQKKYSGISDQQFQNYLQKIFNFNKSPRDFTVDEVDFKMKHMPYYISKQNQAKNDNFVVRLFFPLDQNQRKKIDNLRERLDIICQPFAKNDKQFKILVDAEQSYVQKAIEAISEQLQQTYNKQRLYIIPTVQNYLKSSVQRTNYEVEIAKRKNLYFGAKLVRGAYIVQETNLSIKHKYDNPVVDCFQKTTENYLNNFRAIISNHSKGQCVVATHNQDTILETAKIAKEINGNLRVSYAQLLGLADHLTFKSKIDGFRVYKYLPWAKVDVMIGYMIRRAQELSQMKYPLDAQFELLQHELKTRYLS